MDKPLTGLTKKKERGHRLPISGMKKGLSLQTPQTGKGKKREYRKQLYTQKFNNSYERDQFLKKQILPDREALASRPTLSPELLSQPFDGAGNHSVSQLYAEVLAIAPSAQSSKFLEMANLLQGTHLGFMLPLYISTPWNSPSITGSTTLCLKGCLLLFMKNSNFL